MNKVKFREQAIRARRLALAMGDEATSRTLRTYAEVCEARAAAIEAREAVFRGDATQCDLVSPHWTRAPAERGLRGLRPRHTGSVDKRG